MISDTKEELEETKSTLNKLRQEVGIHGGRNWQCCHLVNMIAALFGRWQGHTHGLITFLLFNSEPESDKGCQSCQDLQR